MQEPWKIPWGVFTIHFLHNLQNVSNKLRVSHYTITGWPGTKNLVYGAQVMKKIKCCDAALGAKGYNIQTGG
jgi:hypothetical protein